jgi:hypothetical protein
VGREAEGQGAAGRRCSTRFPPAAPGAWPPSSGLPHLAAGSVALGRRGAPGPRCAAAPQHHLTLPHLPPSAAAPQAKGMAEGTVGTIATVIGGLGGLGETHRRARAPPGRAGLRPSMHVLLPR